MIPPKSFDLKKTVRYTEFEDFLQPSRNRHLTDTELLPKQNIFLTEPKQFLCGIQMAFSKKSSPSDH